MDQAVVGNAGILLFFHRVMTILDLVPLTPEVGGFYNAVLMIVGSRGWVGCICAVSGWIL